MSNILKQYTYAMLMAQVFTLQRFAEAGTVVNTTTGITNAYTGEAINTGAMSAGMKIYYDTELLENARNKHYFAQFGKKAPLPANRGMIMEWRKWDTLPMADILKESVIPSAKPFGMSSITGGIRELGMYVSISQQLQLHHIDDVLLGATGELGASAGDTQDTAIRNVLAEGTNVIYAPSVVDGEEVSEPEGRWALDMTCKLTPDLVNQVYTYMRKTNVPEIDGKYVAVIHPSVAYDLRKSDEWLEAHKYARPEEIYNGEIGEMHNVRFVVSPTAPVWKGDNLNGSTAHLTATAAYVTNDSGGQPDHGSASQYRLTISETPTAELVGRYVHVYDTSATAFVSTVKIVGVNTTSKYLWLDIDLGMTPAAGDKLYPGEGAIADPASGDMLAVYGCLFFGRDAYGIIDPEGAGLEMIVKTAKEVGGPLEQFSTAGYKLSEGTKILYQDRIVRVECCSKYSRKDAGNTAPFRVAQ